ncbi:uncharacterized protein LOC135112632 isoform X3 [Scylla paramamosain]|uniref:uncharacterized protein LOC135112632 isoform X3 n=1 Tax=Scylla paramamosain TaxID=85552 RepID=UPI0030827CAE
MRVEARLDGLSWSGGGGERWGVVCIPDKLVFCKMTCLADISSDKATTTTTTTTTTMTLPEEAAGAVGFKEQLYETTHLPPACKEPRERPCSLAERDCSRFGAGSLVWISGGRRERGRGSWGPHEVLPPVSYSSITTRGGFTTSGRPHFPGHLDGLWLVTRP